MDNVTGISINYTIIRRPKMKTSNILSYAAKIHILIDNSLIISDNDFAILDFALSLFEWRKSGKGNFFYYPMDDDKLFIGFIMDGDYYNIERPLCLPTVKLHVSKDKLFTGVDEFLTSFDKYLKKHGDKLSRYNYSLK